MRYLRIYTRYWSLSPVYLNISREEWDRYKKYCSKIDPIFMGDDWDEKVKEVGVPYIMWLTERQQGHLVKAVTFGTMCLEAFIYDYAAHNLTDTYVKNYLDKLDVVSKWVVVPKLITGNDFPRDSKAFEDLRMLIKTRNDFVHSKSGPMVKDSEEVFKRYELKIKKDIRVAIHFGSTSPYETVIEVLTELRKLEGETEIGTQWWQLEKIDGEQ